MGFTGLPASTNVHKVNESHESTKMEFQIDYATSSFGILEASLGVLLHKGTASRFNLLILEERLHTKILP